jgi:hypothetical protein
VETLIKIFPIKGKASGLFFREREISSHGWEIEGKDHSGRKVYRQGGDPQKPIASCTQDAKQINERNNLPS